MANENKQLIGGVEIDKQKADNVLRWLLNREATNLKTRERSETQMITDIQKRIEEEVKQCY